MSLDRSLKSASGLTKHRNVLTRAERIDKLADAQKFNPEEDDPLGLLKVANRKVIAGGKSPKKAEAEGEGTEPAGGQEETAPPTA